MDVVTNSASLAHRPPVRIDDRGWTHRLPAYDGHGHLYGIAGGLLIQYLVSQPKPAGTAHIGRRTENRVPPDRAGATAGGAVAPAPPSPNQARVGGSVLGA